MNLKSDRHLPLVILDLEGELDADGSTALEERCLYEQQEGALYFVIGLAGVSRVTGPGLRVLLGLARSLPRSGGSLVLCELEPNLVEALRVSGLDGSFDLAPDRASALSRSQELQSRGRAQPPPDRAEADERIAFAIELLGSSDPRP